jgi:hypothetical protein
MYKNIFVFFSNFKDLLKLSTFKMLQKKKAAFDKSVF